MKLNKFHFNKFGENMCHLQITILVNFVSLANYAVRHTSGRRYLLPCLFEPFQLLLSRLLTRQEP